MDDVERSWMTITGLDDTNTTSVTTTSDHAQVTSIEFDVFGDGTSFDIKDNGIVDLDVWVWVSDGTGIVGYDEWDTLLSNTLLGDLAKLVSGFFSGDSVDSESTFDVIDESEGFVGLLECDDIHETGWEGGITSDFAVDLDQILLKNFLDFVTSQCIMKTITQKDDQWEAFTLLVWTLGWFWSKNTGQFVQHPVGWGIETLQMFLLTTGHFYFVV